MLDAVDPPSCAERNGSSFRAVPIIADSAPSLASDPLDAGFQIQIPRILPIRLLPYTVPRRLGSSTSKLDHHPFRRGALPRFADS